MVETWKQMRVIAVAAVVVMGACRPFAVGAEPTPQVPAPAQAADADEEAFDDKLREFGYWAGAAYACVDAAKQAEVERKVLDTFNGIARLFGTDRAFFYAAAFGNGTTHKVEAGKCPELLDKFQKATAARGGRP